MDAFEAVSDGLASAVEQAGRSVVRLEGRRRGGASGVAIERDVIVAAHHSVEVDEMPIGWPDGSVGRARVVGRDPSTDVVVLRAEGGAAEPVAWDEAARLRPGSLVAAALRPGRSVRAAIGSVSVVGDAWRTHSGGRIDGHVQLDISMQHGVSGALVTAASGRPVGLAATGLIRSTVMLIPASTVRRVAEGLLVHGHVRRGYLGIGTIPVRLPAPEEPEGRAALLVTFVQPGAAAGTAGLIVGDVLLAFDGHRVASPGDLQPLLDGDRIGAEVVVKILRAGEPRDLGLRIGSSDESRRS